MKFSNLKQAKPKQLCLRFTAKFYDQHHSMFLFKPSPWRGQKFEGG